MSSPSSSPAFTLEQEISKTHQLLQMMQQEQGLLVKADIKGLDELVKSKSVVVEQLLELAKLRNKNLEAAGFKGKEASMQAWLDNLSASKNDRETYQKQWTELVTLTKSAKETNRINGLLIGSHMKRNQQAFNALNNATKGESLYGPDGQRGMDITARYLATS